MISVIIPMFNAEKSIIKSLDSVKNQTYSGVFEIIVVNDGSRDNSRNLAEDYIEKNPEMQISLINQENGGVSKARNVGLKMAKGDYIALLDSDDEWLPQKTERQMKYLLDQNLNIDFLLSVRNNEKILYPYSVDLQTNLVEITLKKLLIRVLGHTSTVIFKRAILENTGFFDEKQRYSEDMNYWMRITKNNKIYLLAENLVFTGNGKRSFGYSGLSANIPEMEKGIQKNILEMYQTKRMGYFEYIFYYLFSKFKYFLRLIRLRF